MTDGAPPVSQIGYRRPPVHSQFKKGQPSANPKGRPRKPRGIDFSGALSTALAKKVDVPTVRGTRRISRSELLSEILTQAAAQGNTTALDLISRFERITATQMVAPHGVKCGVLAVCRTLPPGEWEAAAARIKCSADPLDGLPGIDAAALHKARAEKDKQAAFGFAASDEEPEDL